MNFLEFIITDIDFELLNIFELITENDWSWSILEFYGSGIPPKNLYMEKFEIEIRTSPVGYLMNWDQITIFIKNIFQTYDTLIIADININKFQRDRSKIDNFNDCKIVIEVIDGSLWKIGSYDKQLLIDIEKLSKQYGGMNIKYFLAGEHEMCNTNQE